jgi:hypothetical protein
MSHQLDPKDAETLRQLLCLPSTLTPNTRVPIEALPVEELRRALGLPELRHTRFLSHECWLAGGRLLRWLGRKEDGPDDNGDYDFFFPSLQALERTAQRMRSEGYQFHRTLNQTRSFRGLVSGYIGDQEPADSVFGPTGQEFHLSGRRLWGGALQYGLQFFSPEGDVIQLVHSPDGFRQEARTLRVLLEGFDFTICQLGMDHQHIYAGTHAWADLLLRRLRRGDFPCQSPAYSTWRFHKYIRRGFRPYVGTVLNVYRGYVRYMAWRTRQRRRPLPA